MASSVVVPGARHAVAPTGIVSTAWPRIEKTCRNIGWRFDPWQQAVGRLILSKRGGGAWASDLSILSIPRQVGKSYLLGCIIFALCLLTPRLRVIWTSHHTATTEEMYEAMKELAQHKRVAPHVVACTALQGSRWRIRFRNGARVDFGARERGFGRGKAKVGVLVLDEFQHISMRALSNLTPTTNTADNPLILCAGTPPSEHDNAEAFTMRRKAAIDGISTDTVFVEFSADSDADLDDRKQWAKANPSFPKRTPERAFLLNRKILDDESFRREFLGIWDEGISGGDLSYQGWLELRDPLAERGSNPTFGVELVGDRVVWVAVAWRREDGTAQVMLANDGMPLPAHRAVDECRRLCSEWSGVVASSAFRDEFEREGVDLAPMASTDFATGCGLIADGIEAGAIHHGNQKALNDAVKAAKWRPALTSGERAFLLKDMPEVGPAAAAARALWGMENAAPMPAIY